MASTTSYSLHLEVKLNSLGSVMAVFVTMSELTKRSGSPSVHVSLLVDVGSVLFANTEVSNLLEESLDSSWVVQGYRIEAGDS